jgi:non-ribosomal peptide synthetase component E (peptide arylation enzyme)
MQNTQPILESVAKRYVEQGWWRNQTLLDPFDAAVLRTPKKTAIVAPGGVRLDYAELGGLVNRAACGLASAGVRKGDVVSIQLPNCAEFVVVHLAATRLGAVTNPLLPTYRAKELRYILGFAHTKVVVIPSHHRNFDFTAMYGDLWPGLPELAAIYVVGGGGAKGMRSYNALYAEGEVPPRETPQGNDVTALMFTSGTEATPKGVVHTHNTMMYQTTQMATILQLTSDDVIWMPSPVGHGTGFQWGVRLATSLGATLVLQDMWEVDEALRLIEQERCTFVLSATPFVVMLLDSPALRQPRETSLRIFACAGAAIPPLMGEKARAKMGCTLIGMWGLTECFLASASPVTCPDEKLWTTDGCALPGVELAIFDDTRTHMLAPGEVGEVAVRGPNVSLGYFNDPERTASTFRSDGWLFSNDLATMDGDGFIRIVGRKKDIINRGGLKISSREIEELILDHPAVAQVALIALPDVRLGEKACACLVTRDGADVRFSELANYLSDRGLAKYKLPEFMVILDNLPMTPSGKVQKFRLRDDIIAGAIVTSPPYKTGKAVKDE